MSQGIAKRFMALFVLIKGRGRSSNVKYKIRPPRKKKPDVNSFYAHIRSLQGGVMKVLGHLNYTGRKSRPGRICFDEKGRMCVFVNYCTGCQGKVVMSRQEAQTFSGAYTAERRRLVNRLVFMLVGRKQLPEPAQDDERDIMKREIITELSKVLQTQP